VIAPLKVGALARRTGLTVRTLHHYDEIGLLSPSNRTPSGHRLYGEQDVARLQQIASLRHLGLPLDEIRACLARPEYTLARTLEMQIERIDEQIRHHERLRELVQHLRHRLRTAEEVSVEDLTRTIEVTMRYEKYYTPEQMEQLRRRREEVGDARIEEVQREWGELFAAYRRAMDEGLDPASEEVQALAKRSAALIEEFTGGDPGILASLTDLYRGEGGENVMASHGMDVDGELWAYMGRARAAAGDPAP
jgi:DNA-binding transcriptional MerR regulator